MRFTIARLSLVFVCMVSSMLAVYWLFSPFDLDLRELFGTSGNVHVPSHIWFHVAQTYMLFGGMWDALYTRTWQ